MLRLGIGAHDDFNSNNDGDDEDDDDDDDLKAESWGTRVQRRAGAAVGLRQRRQPHLCGSFCGSRENSVGGGFYGSKREQGVTLGE